MKFPIIIEKIYAYNARKTKKLIVITTIHSGIDFDSHVRFKVIAKDKPKFTSTSLTRAMEYYDNIKNPKPAQPTEYVGCWSDDTETVRQLAKDLKDNGVPAKTDRSHYVGQRILKIDKNHLNKAKELLPSLSSHGEYIINHCLTNDPNI